MSDSKFAVLCPVDFNFHTFCDGVSKPPKLTAIIEENLSRQITLTSQCVIGYGMEDAPVATVEIAWGAMDFVYTDGTWNPTDHCYDGVGWTDNGSGYVTVKNLATDATTVNVHYNTDRSDIDGSFTDGSNPIADVVNISAGQEKTLFLTLSGKPSEYLDSVKIGEVTVAIGGE